MTSIQTQLLDKSLVEIDENRFYDAHETLEAIWYPLRFDESDEIKLIKGFINAVVSLELSKRGKESASIRVWKNYLKYRPLLYKVSSPNLNRYHTIARHVENEKNKII
ncbi:MAG: DUF309 domain-containing protein [Sulfurimonas sp.]|jgi:hypothetical protein